MDYSQEVEWPDSEEEDGPDVVEVKAKFTVSVNNERRVAKKYPQL